MMKKRTFTLWLGLFIAALGICHTYAKDAPLPIEQAIQIVDKRAGGFGNMSPFELQTHYRLMWLLHGGIGYKYEEKHAVAWLNCMRDKEKSIYARLCAGYFLLDQHEEARSFVASQLESENLRCRYNAAEVVRLHVGRNPKKEWGVNLLIGLLADGSIDGSGVTSSPSGHYPQGDRDDIIHTPIDRICLSLGFMKQKKAVPALISVLERRPGTGGAASALGEIGDARAIPILMKVLKDDSGDQGQEVEALGKLKHKEAVPIMLSRLETLRMTSGSMSSILTGKLLEAILEIGDKRAIEPIEKYLQGDSSKGSKAIARRVLVQLKSPDPVTGLLELLDKETYEPERSDIVSALAKHPDSRVVETLAGIARTSDSAFMRREAIFGLENIGNRQSLLVLASLLDLAWPRNLKAEWGWKGVPDFQKYFPETIRMCLQQCTEQDFGNDRKKWEDWINKNLEPKNALHKK